VAPGTPTSVIVWFFGVQGNKLRPRRIRWAAEAVTAPVAETGPQAGLADEPDCAAARARERIAAAGLRHAEAIVADVSVQPFGPNSFRSPHAAGPDGLLVIEIDQLILARHVVAGGRPDGARASINGVNEPCRPVVELDDLAPRPT
jgi:hypothetical protein